LCLVAGRALPPLCSQPLLNTNHVKTFIFEDGGDCPAGDHLLAHILKDFTLKGESKMDLISNERRETLAKMVAAAGVSVALLVGAGSVVHPAFAKGGEVKQPEAPKLEKLEKKAEKLEKVENKAVEVPEAIEAPEAPEAAEAPEAIEAEAPEAVETEAAEAPEAVENEAPEAIEQPAATDDGGQGRGRGGLRK
jgi:hypothetical protein